MDSKEKLLDLINDLNQPRKELNNINVKFTGIVPANETGETILTVAGVPGRGYSGSVDLTYNRLNLTEILDGKTVRSPDPLTPDSFLELVNNAYNLFLTALDVGEITIPELGEGEFAQLTLEANEDSLGFIGGATLRLEFGRSWLDQVIGNKTLNELKHPIKVEYKKSSRMVTWNKDFTCVRDAIAPTKKNEYTDWAALQAACAAYGIPAWSPNRIVDQPTSAVPDANPAFDRVVIQSSVLSASLDGPIYLHYNVLEEI
jgi:hypothetical protein